jgi:hypothetical protein
MFIISAQDLVPDTSRVGEIRRRLKIPNTSAKLETFLGFVINLVKFASNLAEAKHHAYG